MSPSPSALRCAGAAARPEHPANQVESLGECSVERRLAGKAIHGHEEHSSTRDARWAKPRLRSDGTVVGGLAISVSDLDRSLQFYRALGFSIGQPFQVLAAYGPVLGLSPGFQARAVYIRRDRVLIELVEVMSPRITTPPSQGLGVQQGLAHIRFHADSLERLAALVVANGGRLLDDRRTVANGMAYAFCTDPDGVRLMISVPAPA
jgi:catechol 2,3-dioxygenase-like lactoylglutathione lyase family enzyme